MLEYSTKGGKMLRGIMTAAVYLELTGYSPDSEEAKVGYYLGWVEEIIHVGYLIADDLMDQSETRRGQECWYKREEIGDQAVNDGLILQDLAYVLLDKIRNKLDTKYYAKLIEFSRKIGTYTTIGQTYDFIAKIPSFQEYNQIVTYKTAFYTVVSPIVFGLIGSQIYDVDDKFEDIEKFMIRLGNYFQVQDDYIDVYGDPKHTGKIGTDIQDAKISWCYCKAYELANDDQKKILKEKIGHEEYVNDIKQLYADLKIPQYFEEFSRTESEALRTELANLDPKYPKKALGQILEIIIKRKQ